MHDSPFNPGRVVAMLVALFSLCMFSLPASAQQTPDYLLNPGDQIEIAVWKEPELTKTVIVRPDGKFSFALVGEVAAAGRTVPQIQTEVASRLQKYIPDPVVTAAVTTLEGNRVYVIGQVTKPGAFPMNPRLNVLQALTVAGGMTPFANPDGIIVLRGGAGAKQRVLPFRYADVSKGRNLEQNAALEAGDVVIVP
jgi:polysaccharide export outer membrane protein